jgi:Protein of unknown function (DUF1524)/Excalibur calcium-binding domain
MNAARQPLAVLLVLLATTAGCGGTTESSSDSNAVRSGHATPIATPKGKQKAERAARSSQKRRKQEPKTHAKPGGSAAAALAALPVKGRAPKTGYDREQFGDGWASVDGCDTRDRMLDRDLTDKTYVDDCRIESGKLNDPYTATRITYERGGGSEVDIDHVVALGDAWQKGAQRWSYARRVTFANDPLNLLSVDASANRQKSDGDAATWLPPNKRFRCNYVARQVAVKTKYEAWVTQAEQDAIARVLATCHGQKLPKTGRVRVGVVPTHTAPVPEPAVTPSPGETKRGGGQGTFYENCDAARAAGAAPLQRGTADYAANPHLDRDKDGVAFE